MAEVEEAYWIIREIHDGHGEDVANRNLRREGFVGASSSGLAGVNWSSWKGRIRLEDVTALGHSFGAATVVEMLRYHGRFTWFSQGIIYDIWG